MERRGFLGLSLSALGGIAGLFASIPFVKSLWPSAKADADADFRSRSAAARSPDGAAAGVASDEPHRA